MPNPVFWKNMTNLSSAELARRVVTVKYEPGHNIFYKITCVPSEDSNQPALEQSSLSA